MPSLSLFWEYSYVTTKPQQTAIILCKSTFAIILDTFDIKFFTSKFLSWRCRSKSVPACTGWELPTLHLQARKERLMAEISFKLLPISNKETILNHENIMKIRLIINSKIINETQSILLCIMQYTNIKKTKIY